MSSLRSAEKGRRKEGEMFSSFTVKDRAVKISYTCLKSKTME